ncbi:hypothetical protein FRC00_004582 [Tulasnella sp. 408]|nr:hypothetical protein FRC00_004582 [Tulasnella sp. 408]
MMERYVTWMERSKDAPLDISIHDPPLWESAVENIEAIIGLIGPQKERWRSMRIDSKWADAKVIRIILDYLKDCSLPQLQILELRDGGLRGIEIEWLELAIHAPQLKEVKLDRIVTDFESPLFHNLTSLHLKDLNFAAFGSQEAQVFVYQLLRQSPHLKRLSLKESSSLVRPLNAPLPLLVGQLARWPPPENEEPFIHPSLLDLTLDFRNDVIQAIMPSIRFPALRKFCPAQMYTARFESWQLHLLMRNSSFHSLEEITLTGNKGGLQHSANFVEALTILPSLTFLELEFFDIPQVSDLILGLGHLCPRLQTLRVDFCRRVDLDLFRSLVDMRLGTRGITRLQALVITTGIGNASPELRAAKAWFEERVKRVNLITNDGSRL